jgi:Phage integrase family
VLPRRRGGRAWAMQERRFLTRTELNRLRAEIPEKWRPLFDLIAVTGLRISEAIGLRWSDLTLDGRTPHLHVRRAVVKGILVHRNHDTARARFRSRRPWRAISRTTAQLTRTTTPTSFHAAPHVCLAADRRPHLHPALATVDGPPLSRIHARGLRPPARRRPRGRRSASASSCKVASWNPAPAIKDPPLERSLRRGLRYKLWLELNAAGPGGGGAARSARRRVPCRR